ncbi:rhodanese-like domain-containing protein [Aquimarina sp. W85]|uniref:rhodanese-like domain-containing protein n=1 Tax=Aquimarina rhodophyticola TaxID=3342246 RepID=UPI00367303ED
MRYFIYILLLNFTQIIFAQISLDSVMQRHTDGSVPSMAIEDFRNGKDNAIILDTRSKDEFDVSHIAQSVFVGYTDFDMNAFKVTYPNQNISIIVYCSIGVRSHFIGKKLILAGYKNVKNLYGGIFEWKNKGFPIVNIRNAKTDTLHAYSKEWSIYSKNAINIY